MLLGKWYRQTDRRKFEHKDRQIERHTGTLSDRNSDRQTLGVGEGGVLLRKRDRQIDMYTDRQTERQRVG